jgi:hypothetical protein
VRVDTILKDVNNGRIYIHGGIFNASNSTIFVSEISVRVLAVALSSNPMENWSVLD